MSGKHIRLLGPVLPLVCLWALTAWLVEPWGEFTINDDWSFVHSLKALTAEGRMIPTGWGKGGPALIVHLLWGALFTYLFGFSLTVLRISVMVLGLSGSVALLFLLRSLGVTARLSLFGALVLTCNPLFLSQSFTFMTDVTFAALTIFALFWLHRGVESKSTGLIAVGLIFCLAAILTRQIGLVTPLGFICVGLLHPVGRDLGRRRLIILTLVLVFLPWLGWEWFLAAAGSTPVTRHEVFNNIYGYFVRKGPVEYIIFLLSRFLLVSPGYLAFSLAPLLLLQTGSRWSHSRFRVILAAYATVFFIFEALILAGAISPPVRLHYNVLTPQGLGPLLFKDTYLLGYERFPLLTAPLFYLLVFFTAPLAVFLLARIVSSLKKLLTGDPPPFTSALALVSGLAYLGIITFTGFHDRYLIPVIALFIIWLLSDAAEDSAAPGLDRQGAAAGAVLLLLAVLSVAGLHDFMAVKRAALKAHEYLTTELKADPCRVDGGFEFNGFHCNRPDFKPRPGLSWWWVDREDYLVTLGPLPDYQIVKLFPVRRWLGRDGAVYVLKPSLPLGAPEPS
ncbi:MAG: glycosyltransferase family 39 protein [Thermodesulfobacteriota bacterium]